MCQVRPKTEILAGGFSRKGMICGQNGNKKEMSVFLLPDKWFVFIGPAWVLKVMDVMW
jgi:hypothetical protein